MKRREQPRLDLGLVPQLMPLGRPQIEGLLRQIAGPVLVPRKTQREAEQVLVVSRDQLFEVDRIHVLESGINLLYSRQPLS